MIAIDTSAFIAHLSGDAGADIETVDAALTSHQGMVDTSGVDP